MDKKDNSIVIHMDAETKRLFDALANIAGSNNSLYGFNIIRSHIDHKFNKYIVLKEMFEGDGTDKTNKTESQ